MLPQEHTVAPCTIFRIYRRQYQLSVATRLPRKKPQLYIKEVVGQEIQMDCSFPWGYGTKIVSFDCVDDRSRFALARIYERHTQDNAIAYRGHNGTYHSVFNDKAKDNVLRKWTLIYELLTRTK